MNRKNYLFPLLALSLTGRLTAQQTHDSLSAQMDTIFKKYGDPGVPGTAVAVLRDGQVIYKKCFGLANLEYARPITPSSIFDLCSLTKQFTGLAISTLMQEGKISGADDVRHYLPRVPRFGKRVTIDQLLHHTSGLRDYPEALMLAGWRYSELCTRDDVMNLVSREKELDFAPGSQEAYCNTDYVLLAAVVEKVTGTTFPDWIRAHVFGPLHMDHSFILSNSSAVVPDLATSYAPDAHGYQKFYDVLSAYGSSCLYSTLDDLCEWVLHFQQRLDAGDPVYRRMLTGTRLAGGDTVSYGFGLEQTTYNGLRTIWHTGAWCGYRTAMIDYPGEHFAIILLNNAADNDIGGLYLREVAALFLKDKLPTNAQAVEKLRAMPALHLDTTDLGKYTGWFKLQIDKGPTLHLVLEKGELTGYNGNNRFGLQARTASAFYDSLDHATITFDNANAFTFQDAGITIPATRTAGEPEKKVVFRPTPAILSAFTGTYYSDELQTTYTIDIEAGHLALRQARRGEFDLHANPYVRSEFDSDTGRLDFYRDSKGHIAGFTLTGDRVRHMRFIKR